MILTKEMLHGAGTKHNGFTKAQLLAFGISWPPKKGWLKSLVGKDVPLEAWNQFLKMSSTSQRAIKNYRMRNLK